MAQARVVALNEVKKGDQGEWNLCFQRCRYEYGGMELSRMAIGLYGVGPM